MITLVLEKVAVKTQSLGLTLFKKSRFDILLSQTTEIEQNAILPVFELEK